MTGGIFLIQDQGDLIELAEQPYEAEGVLQLLLAEHPNILAGDQVNPTAPRRWLLIAREAAIPGEEGGAGRWALDHLFLDQDAIPTLVEVKRSSDTRTRREVVGQMLDYAANAVVYWPVDAIRAQFEATCLLAGRDPDATVAGFLESSEETEAFWQTAKRNLQAGRLRLVFVADAIPAELRRIVEFLNGQMDPAEVIAVEVRQFVGHGVRALVPQVVGQTAAAQQAKAGVRAAGQRQWDEPSFFTDLETRRGSQDAAVARHILAWARDAQLRIWWGKGQQDGSFYPMVDLPTGQEWTIATWTYGRVEIQFQQLARAEHPFASEATRLELRRRLNDVPGIEIPETVIAKRPAVALAVLHEPDALRCFLHALDWLVAQLRSAPSSPEGQPITALESSGEAGI